MEGLDLEALEVVSGGCHQKQQENCTSSNPSGCGGTLPSYGIPGYGFPIPNGGLSYNTPFGAILAGLPGGGLPGYGAPYGGVPGYGPGVPYGGIPYNPYTPAPAPAYGLPGYGAVPMGTLTVGGYSPLGSIGSTPAPVGSVPAGHGITTLGLSSPGFPGLTF